MTTPTPATSRLAAYAKSLVYIALAAFTFLVTAAADNQITLEELLNLVVIVVGAVGVYAIPNLPGGIRPYAKTGVAFAIAGLVALLSFLSGGVTISEWMQVTLAAFAGIGVYVTPNDPTGE